MVDMFNKVINKLNLKIPMIAKCKIGMVMQ